MKLIDVRTYMVQDFPYGSVPPYAILSHTWEQDEVTFWEMQSPDSLPKKDGFAKIAFACKQAMEDDLEWLWIDTCCIDKTSSAELSEAINSMYKWYKNSEICYAYLADVSDTAVADPYGEFCTSRWFTRGWTLQELIASPNVKFYNRTWGFIGWKLCSDRHAALKMDSELLNHALSQVTGVPEDVLGDESRSDAYSVAQRFSWASRRQCTFEEDVAYCLIGLFGVNMAPLYGEGPKAFARLQEEILRDRDDNTLFAWTVEEEDPRAGALTGIFAHSLWISRPAPTWRSTQQDRIAILLVRSKLNTIESATNSVRRLAMANHCRIPFRREYMAPAYFRTWYILRSASVPTLPAKGNRGALRIRGVTLHPGMGKEIQSEDCTLVDHGACVNGSVLRLSNLRHSPPSSDALFVTHFGSVPDATWDGQQYAFTDYLGGPTAFLVGSSRLKMPFLIYFALVSEAEAVLHLESSGAALPVALQFHARRIPLREAPFDAFTSEPLVHEQFVIKCQAILENNGGVVGKPGTSVTLEVTKELFKTWKRRAR
ncbi:unnamed protein product [Parascedosporium putredinis]|uniref:Heterokaryon incompatibility domain-containing protein n=1 Tax=Parascedosporium putredinis TaxID=1442378 RepID=A0A9P1H207_9PEZI|nr:unnamed protein product [Parascedosporium putredinis]CAI7993172.1 unnamed protein product [Parascedosporium putredinis]